MLRVEIKSICCATLIGTISIGFGIFLHTRVHRHRRRFEIEVKDKENELLALTAPIVKRPKSETQEKNEFFSCALFFPCYYPERPDSSISQLMNIIGAAKKSLEVCVMTIQYVPLVQLLIKKQNEGIQVKIYTSHGTEKSRGGQFRKHGIQVRSKHFRYSTAMHNKYVIIDNCTVLTGSLNWTKQAILTNQENVLVTSHSRIVSKYIEGFAELWEMFDEYKPKRKLNSSETSSKSSANAIATEETPVAIPWSYGNYVYRTPEERKLLGCNFWTSKS